MPITCSPVSAASIGHRKPLLAGALLVGALLALLCAGERPLLLLNVTPSVPVGLYYRAPSGWSRGDLVALSPPEAARDMLAAYGALHAGHLLIKYVAGVPGDTVCRQKSRVTLNGSVVATAMLATSRGRPLPHWSGCARLTSGQVFLLTSHPASFDGRYLGPFPASSIVGVLRPLLVAPADGVRP